MKALTLWQPWAWAILYAGKDIENRPWWLPKDLQREDVRILIHAGLRYDRQAEGFLRRLDIEPPDPDDLPRGAIVGSVTVRSGLSLASHNSFACVKNYADLQRFPYRCSPWAVGGANGLGPMYHWALANPKILPRPLPCRGFQRLWAPPMQIVADALGQLGEKP